ncbi:MAG: YraN family protein [Actinobacteria bacterium]|nr:YraN family protein [Actinomycetota bacterium]
MPRPSALLAAAKPRHAASSVARALTSTRARHLPWRAFRAREARGRHWTGQSAERRVRRHFLLRGYRVLATNAWAGGNELDLVVRRGRQLIFCEVKAKTGDRFGHPWEAVTPEKERRVRRAVDAWLAARPELADLDVELEAVAVRGRRIERAPIG